MELNHLSSRIIQAAIAVHKELGPGLLESVYQSCIVIELENMGIKFKAQVSLPIAYRGKKVDGQGLPTVQMRKHRGGPFGGSL